MIKFGDSVFQFYSASSFRFDRFSEAFINKIPLIADNHTKASYSAVEQKIKNGILFLETSELKIRFKESQKTDLTIWYKLKGKWKKWKYGQKDRHNLKGADLDMFRYPKFRGRQLTEGVISKSGYFVYEDKTQTFWDKDFIQQKKQSYYKVVFFIGYGEDYQKGLDEYSLIFGKVPMIPKWALGFWYSRYYAYHQKEYLKLLDDYKKHHIPLDVLVIDTDWREKVWHGYDWAEKYFPQPKAFIREVKKRGIKITLNDHPGYFDSEILPQSDSAYKHIQKKTKISGDWRCNWKNKKDVKLFLDYLIKPKLKAGIDFWWIDGWGADGFRRNEEAKNRDKMELSPFSKNEANSQFWLNYQYYKATQEATKKRGLILSRWGGAGSHRYPVWFSGDTVSSWKTLKYQVYFTHTGSNLLIHYWSHDIGGFLGQIIDKELFIRWFQFGALSPVFRTHSDHGIREPWKFDKETLKIFQTYVHLRYKLLPYFYNFVSLSYFSQKALVQPLYYISKNKKAYTYKQEYLLGDAILAAPVTAPLSRKKKKKIFIPEGRWYNVFKKEVVTGPKVVNVPSKLDVLPLFVRQDSIIPLTKIESPIQADYKFLRLEIFPEERQESFVYIDDGETEGYLKKQFARIPVSMVRKDDDIEIVLDQPEGKYKIKNKTIEIVLHFADRKVLSVQSGKKPLSFKKEKQILYQFPSPYSSYSFILPYRKNKLKIYIRTELTDIN